MGNKDSLLLYALILVLLTSFAAFTVAIIVDVPQWLFFTTWLGQMIGLVGGTIYCIENSMVRPVKIYSPIPWKLGTWRFIFYCTEGSELISPEDMMIRKLK